MIVSAEQVMLPPYAEILRAGAHDVDEHFRTAPFEDNIPVMLGLTGVWNTTFLGYPSLAILPYTQALSKLAPHIQQVTNLSSLTHPLSSHVHLDDCHSILWVSPYVLCGRNSFTLPSSHLFAHLTFSAEGASF